MALSVIGQIPTQVALAAAGSTSSSPSIPVVIITGISLVFAILIILYLVLLLQGKIFKGIDEKKRQAQENAAPKADIAAQVAPVVAAPAPRVEDGIPPEVVAAIAAAVNHVGEGQYTLQSIEAVQGSPATPQQPADRRGRWGFAGVIASTEPF